MYACMITANVPTTQLSIMEDDMPVIPKSQENTTTALPAPKKPQTVNGSVNGKAETIR